LRQALNRQAKRLGAWSKITVILAGHGFVVARRGSDARSASMGFQAL